MIPPLIKRIALALAALVLLAALTVLVLVRTPLGIKLADQVTRPLIENVVAEQLGSSITYDPLTGRLPNNLVMRNITMVQDGEPWAKVEQFTLRWEILALLKRQIQVRDLVLNEGHLIRLPTMPPRADEPDEPTDKERGLPSISARIDNLVVDDFMLGEEVLGQAYTLSLFGEGRYRDRRLRFEVVANTEEQTDTITASGAFDTKGVTLEATIISEIEGLISELMKAQGRTELRAFAEGPWQEVNAQIGIDASRYGQLEGSASASVEALDQVKLALTYQPGSVLPAEAQAALGEAVELVATGQWTDDVLSLTVERFSAAFGSFGGTLTAKLNDQLEGGARLSGQLNEDVLAAYGTGSLAGPFKLDATVEKDADVTRFDGSASAGLGRLTVADGQSSPDLPFRGLITLTAKELETGQPVLDSLLAEGAKAIGTLRLSSDQTLTLSGFEGVLGTTPGRRISATGSARHNLDTQALRADLNVTAGARLAPLLVPDLSLDEALKAKASAQGSLRQLKVESTIAIPRGRFDQTSFAAGQLIAQLTGWPDRPVGALTLTSSNGSYEGNAALSAQDATYQLTSFAFSAGGADVTAQASYDGNRQSGTLKAQLMVPPGTSLPTGQVISGQMEIEADMADRVTLDASARSLRYDAYEIGALTVEAEGPRENVSFDLDINDLTAGAVFVQHTDASGSIATGEATTITLDQLDILFPGRDERRITLTAPATLTLAEAITLSPTAVRVFDDGSLEATASFAPDRWQADVAIEALPLPRWEAEGAMTLALDTNRTKMADLAVTLSAEYDDETYVLEGRGGWDGRSADLAMGFAPSGKDAWGELVASLPVTLVRDQTLAVDIPGDGLKATLDYEGDIGPPLAFAVPDPYGAQGQLSAHVSVQGQLDAPQTEGTIKLVDASIEDQQVGLTLRSINGGINFAVATDGTHGDVDIRATGAAGRADSVRLFGTVDKSVRGSQVDLQLNLDQAQLARSGELELRLSSDLALNGNFSDLMLTGPIRVDELDLAIPEIEAGENIPQYAPVNIVRVDMPDAQPVTDEKPTEPASALTIGLDLTVKARNGVFARGRGLQSEWGIDLAVTGTTADPVLVGDIDLQRGTLSLAGRSFDITRGTASFSRSGGLEPFIRLAAQTEAGTGQDAVTAIVNVVGRPDDLAISFSSNPPLPEEDVLALILFGRPANTLGATEALQLAQAVATLTGTGPFGGGGGLGASLRSGLGLDQLSLDPAGRALTVGKYLSEDIYVSARQSLGELGTVISIVYELSRFINVEATMRPLGQSIGANYKRDY